MATVADLYAQVLGRAPDAAGLAYWESMFGSSVDPSEAATFKSVAAVTEPTAAVAPTAVDTSTAPAGLWNQVDPSSAINAALTAQTPTTVEDLYKKFYGTVDPAGAAYWKQQFGSSVDPLEQAKFIKEVANNDPNVNTGVTVEQAFKTYLGGNTDQAGIDYWKNQLGTGQLNAGQLAQLTNRQYGLMDEGGGLFGGGGFLGTGVNWTDIRDPLEAAAVVAGNYILPGSSLLTGQLVSEGAKEQLNTDLGRVANLAAGVAGGYQGNTANYGKLVPGSSGLEGVTPEQLAAANATEDPIAALNAIKGWTTADLGYLASIGGMTPEILSAATANNAYLAGGAAATGINTPAGTGTGVGTGVGTGTLTGGLTGTDLTTLAKAGLTATGLLGGAKAISNLTGGAGGVTLPTQDRSGVSSGTAQYSPEYYQAIQAKYNQMMPQQPRDVTTELKNWYETKYAPSTPKVA